MNGHTYCLYVRSKKGSDNWHSCITCSKVPLKDDDVDIVDSRPSTNELCPECQALLARGGSPGLLQHTFILGGRPSEAFWQKWWKNRFID